MFSSGSLCRFWEIKGFIPGKNPRPIPELAPKAVLDASAKSESKRVTIKTRPGRLSLEELASLVTTKPGPRLVILNTIQSAAVLANHLRYNLHHDVEHLSTALCPHDRAITLARIHQRLATGWPNGILVATSCVEAGMNFSFRTGFRERCSLTSLLQPGGRVNREFEHETAEIWDFQHDEDSLLSIHPHFKVSARVLESLLTKYGRALNQQHCTEALSLEINHSYGDAERSVAMILEQERQADYPEVTKSCRLITDETTTVIVDQNLIQRLKQPIPTNVPSVREIMLHSVQVWGKRLEELKLVTDLGIGGDLLGIQPDHYDEFLGYMRGVINHPPKHESASAPRIPCL